MKIEELYQSKERIDPANNIYDKVDAFLPDLFTMKDGSCVATKEDWKKRRQELLDLTVDLCFGGMPPKPEVFGVQKMYGNTYRITAGTKERTCSFELQLFKPAKAEGKCPVVITADSCAHYFNDAIMKDYLDKGYIVAQFNRAALAEDMFSDDRSTGVYPVYPDLKFGMISAWAWGYHRVIDALETMDDVDMDCIAITGHSRGGKATLLAGATDERVTFTQASGSGLFGCGCFRYTQYENADETITDDHAERLENMLGVNVPYPTIQYWFGLGMADYMYKEKELPFDLHFLKAAIAPRWLLESGGVDDVWANPRGDYQTYRAAKEAFKFLGCPERLAASWRSGGHGHKPDDFARFLDFIETARQGKTYLWDNADAIFGKLPRIYDWEAPKCEE